MKISNHIPLEYKLGFHDEISYAKSVAKGISEKIVREISKSKDEPEWMTGFRLTSLKKFKSLTMPSWAPKTKINFDNFTYYLNPTKKKASSWSDLPENIKKTYEKIGVPQKEREFLAGVEAQYDSQAVYGSIKKKLDEQGVLFTDTDTALKKYPQYFKKYFGKLIPPTDNKFAALNSTFWSGGSFVYVPKNTKVTLPLQAYFRINAKNFGQFERTLIIADEGSEVTYQEGCLPKDEMVSVGDRWVEIYDIRKGDKVLGHDGKKHEVVKTMTRFYKGNLLKISTFSSFNAFKLTPEHPVLAIKRNEVLTKRKPRKNWQPESNTEKILSAKPEFIEAKNLSVGDFILFPRNKEPNLNESLSIEQLKFLGIYLAEGSVYYHKTIKQYIVSISLCESEIELTNEVKKLFASLSGKKPIVFYDKKRHGVDVRVYSKSLYEFCLTHCGKGAHTKIISEVVMKQKPEFVKHFVDYYFLGDGNLYKRGRSYMCRAATVSANIAIQMQILLEKLGHFTTIKIRKGSDDLILGRKIRRTDQYILYYTPDKKMGEIRESDDYYFLPIKKIEVTSYDGNVYNLKVEGCNSYVVRGFAVHNCSAPVYATESLHAAVVEIFVGKNAKVRYVTVQNWSSDVYNLVTKRARVEENGSMQWLDVNIGSKLTMKYPSCYLVGRGAKGETLSLAIAGKNQLQDTGAKMIHIAPETSSNILSKSISFNGGTTAFRGVVQVNSAAKGSKTKTKCDAMILDNGSGSDTYPNLQVDTKEVVATHEATVSKLEEEQIFYLMSRGITRGEAESLIVNGFADSIIKELPIEYGMEIKRLLEMEFETKQG